MLNLYDLHRETLSLHCANLYKLTLMMCLVWWRGRTQGLCYQSLRNLRSCNTFGAKTNSGLTLHYISETNFEFASYYASNMVLQRDPSNAVIWGYATEVGDLVTLNVQDEDYSTVAVSGEFCKIVTVSILTVPVNNNDKYHYKVVCPCEQNWSHFCFTYFFLKYNMFKPNAMA